MCRTPEAVATALLLLVPGISAAQSVNMGSTFHGLEARARRVTTTFPDVVIDVRRGDAQSMEAILRNRDSGAERGRLHVSAASRRVQWQRGASGEGRAEFALPDQAIVSLDWAAYQLYALHADDVGGDPVDVSGDEGAWDGHLRRSRRALGRGLSAGQLAARVERVETEFDEVVVRAELDRHVRPQNPGRRIDYSRFTATITDRQTGGRRGFVRWFDTAQVLTWKIEGGSQGVILPDRLPGGWTFTPTMAWANVQAYQFATLAAKTLEPVDPFAGLAMFGGKRLSPPFMQIAGAVAPLPSAALSLSGVVARNVLADMPSLGGAWMRGWSFGGRGGTTAVNEPGCDNLHWLDGSIFRACCDVHDRCYETNGCNASSWWWPFSGSWSCERCNAQVVYCFCTVSNPAYCGGGLVGSGGQSGGAASGGCTSVGGGFCPIECQTCQAS